jgi:asparagine synthase (glutamine-hydrolysing)
MCGICGIVDRDARFSAEQAQMHARIMFAQMTHRGPDGGLLHQQPGVVFGAQRLAIRSLDSGHPPLYADDTGVLLVCNGEIDNHAALRADLLRRGFKVPAGGDIAVLPALYRAHGPDFVRRIVGVFALALWDARAQRLILARDRAGERHLYYSVEANCVRFASELAALRAGAFAAPGLDRDTLVAYLAHGYCPAPRTPYTGYRKLAPGELLVIETGRTHSRSYAPPPWGEIMDERPDAERFDSLMRQAVARQSAVDAPFGVMLSGGLDSSLIAALARQQHPHAALSAYCVRFAESSYDEGAQAERVAQRLGYRFVPVTIGALEFPPLLRDLIRHSGELLADPAWIPLARLCRRARQDVPMLLAGEGADELFGGYPTYLGALAAARYARLPAPLHGLAAAIVARLPVSDRKVTVSFLLKRFMLGAGLAPLPRHQQWLAALPPALLARLGLDAARTDAADLAGLDVLDALQSYDFSHGLAEALLAKSDRGGMRFAVELRAPFLDAGVIDFAARLPAAQRVRGLTTKVFLKHYARRHLPRDVVHQRKRGLSVPLAAWLRDPLREWARQRLGHPGLAELGLDARALQSLLQEHCARQADHGRALWALLVLAEWLDWHAAGELDATLAAARLRRGEASNIETAP